jgi:SAM-dependent methyltransferase
VVKAALGSSLYDYPGAHPEEAGHFAGAMSELSDGSARQIVARYDVSSFRRIVDVGGSHGTVLRRLLEAAPQAKGVLFDRPEVVARAQLQFHGTELAERIEFVGGDFLAEVPADGDLYVLREVLHNWDDEHASRIVENCHRGARPGSTLLLGEIVLPARAELQTEATQPTADGTSYADPFGTRLAQQLRQQVLDSVWDEAGRLRPAVLTDPETREIIPGTEIGNPYVRDALTADGSNIADWGTYETGSIANPVQDPLLLQ